MEQINKKSKKKILVFGTFDGLDKGHEFFLRRAKHFGDNLYVSVARDEHVRDLKHKSALTNEVIRLNSIRNLPFVTEAVLSDRILGLYDVIKKFEPDMIVLGFDQSDLETDIIRWLQSKNLYIPIKRMKEMKM